jgi:hypothetical protein
LSIGLEHPEDLIVDIDNALKSALEVCNQQEEIAEQV